VAVGEILGAAERLRRSEIAEAIRRERAVAILRRLPPADVDATVEALLRGGFRIVEFTFDSEDAAGTIARWRESGRALVGAGTIRRVEEVDPAVEAGAQFLVAPTYQPAVVERALELGVSCVPGALSATEIDSAWQQGATFVKLFPGAIVGPGYLRAVLAPLRDVEILVTGGVDASSARSFLDVGAVAVGVSTAQLGQPAGGNGDYSAVEHAAAELLAAVAR
jgi:2-dehydro-3-deoxyphosphogluconate aldolase/(4S)-4-hydroxy-2-oxoglutarate aldolase